MATGKLPLPKVSGTWINKLAATAEGKTAAPQTSAATAASSPETDLETMVEKAKRRNQRSNASVFDISGRHAPHVFSADRRYASPPGISPQHAENGHPELYSLAQ